MVRLHTEKSAFLGVLEVLEKFVWLVVEIKFTDRFGYSLFLQMSSIFSKTTKIPSVMGLHFLCLLRRGDLKCDTKLGDDSGSEAPKK